jgi:undecaprenyl-diphosphatase
MPRILLPVSEIDLVATRAISMASPAVSAAFAAGWLCDARVLFAGGALWHLATPHGSEQRDEAARFLITIACTTAVHHAIKRVVDQKRPDRIIGKGQRRTGRALDAIPSGHAMHAGAIAAFFSQTVKWPSGLWSTAIALAAARVAVLAHWPSGVALGFAGGVAVERLVRRLRPRTP